MPEAVATAARPRCACLRPRPRPCGARRAQRCRARVRRSTARCRSRTRFRSSACRSRTATEVNAGSRTILRWNGSTVGRPVTSNSSSARRERSSASSRRRPGHDELGEQRVERAGDDVAGRHAAVDANAGPAGQPKSVDRSGRRQEAEPGVLAVDPELERVPVRRRVVVVEHAALGDAELLAHQVDAGDLLGHRMLDLQPGVHLEERDRAVLGDQEFAGSGADVADLFEDGLRRRVERRRSARPTRNGAGASSTSFWWRRCSEQSRVEITTTLPCESARHWVSTCRGSSRYFSTKHSPRPNAAIASRVADSNSSGISSRVRATLRPRPPPPNAALMATGSP